MPHKASRLLPEALITEFTTQGPSLRRLPYEGSFAPTNGSSNSSSSSSSFRSRSNSSRSCCIGGTSSCSSNRRDGNLNSYGNSRNSRPSGTSNGPDGSASALYIRRFAGGFCSKNAADLCVLRPFRLRSSCATLECLGLRQLPYAPFKACIASPLPLHSPLRSLCAAAVAAGAEQKQHIGCEEQWVGQQQGTAAKETAGAHAPVFAAARSSNACILLKPSETTPGGIQRRRLVRLGHPWIFDFEVENIKYFSKLQTGKLLPVYDDDGTYLGSGLFSRQASVAVRMVTRSTNSSNGLNGSSSSRSSAVDAPSEGRTSELLCDRFRAALQRRRLRYARQSRPVDSTNVGSSTHSSSTRNGNSTGLPNVWRAVDGEADGLPGVELDVYESAAVLRLSSQSMLPYKDAFVDLIKEALDPSTLSLQTLKSKKEKCAQGGAEYVSELVVGSDPIAWISAWGLSQPVHLSFPPFAAFSNHSLQLLPLLRRHCAGATLLSVNGSSKGIGICCCSSNPFPQLKEHSRQDAGGRTEGKVQNNISKAQLEGAASLVLLETSQTVHTLNEKAAAANDLSSAVSCIHTEDVLQEMANFKASALRFRGVYVHLNPNVLFSAAERGGQFGRWFRPSLRGIESQWTAAASLVESGGLLATSLLLPPHLNSWAVRSLCRAAETAGKKPSLIFASVASPDSRLLTVQTDLWKETAFCVLLR